MFSVCLCSWNDLEYLKLLYNGLKKNTRLPYELIIHDNGSEDGTLDWLKENKINFTRSDQNLGVGAVNFAVEKAKYDYIVDINSDMYPLIFWDTEILKQIKNFENQNVKKYTISSCLIEPVGTNSEYTIINFGENHSSFLEDELIRWFLLNGKKNEKKIVRQYSHPIVMKKSMWKEFGGVDMNYEYGIATDHDLAMSAYSVGCRNFVMLGKSRVYHFVSKTIKKLPSNRSDGHDYFLKKWGISIERFRKDIIKVREPFILNEER